MLIECTCGEKFPVSVNCERHKPNNESASVFVGSRKCPNPNCKLTIYIDAIIMADVDEADENDVIDWNGVREGDTVYFNRLFYTIADKGIRKKTQMNVMALRPVSNGERITVKVSVTGEMFLIRWTQIKGFPIKFNPPQTTDGYESWTEEQLRKFKENKSL